MWGGVWGGGCGCGEVSVGVWGGGCECGKVGLGVVRWCECGCGLVRCGCDVGGCGRWVQVMEHVKIEGVEM